MNAKLKLPPAALLLLIQINNHSINKVCTLKDQQLADKIGKSHSHTVLLISKLREAKIIETIRTGSTEREIIIIDDSVIKELTSMLNLK